MSGSKKGKVIKIFFILAAIVITVVIIYINTPTKLERLKEKYSGGYMLRAQVQQSGGGPLEFRYGVEIYDTYARVMMAREYDNPGDYSRTFEGYVIYKEDESIELVFEDSALSLVSPLQASFVKFPGEKYTYLKITSEYAEWPDSYFHPCGDSVGGFLMFQPGLGPYTTDETYDGPRVDLLLYYWEEELGY